jgi:hypothetical protein
MVRLPKPTLQLRQLMDMGFTDEKKNLAALQKTGGNVEAALTYLC